MARTDGKPTWMEDPEKVITLLNRTKHNFILELPTGRYRLDAGRRMRTMTSILSIRQIQELVDRGDLALEKS